MRWLDNGVLECCCVVSRACRPLLPALIAGRCCCCGPQCECDGCSVLNVQTHCCCCVASAALPCNDEVPLAVSVLGLTVFSKCGCCVPMREIMDR